MAVQNRRLGIACAIGVLFVWSGFLVVARLGIQTSLTAADIAVLRLTVAGGIILPFVGRWWPRDLGLGPTLILMACGPGIIYSLLMFQGLNETSAAYGGVFANGTLPIFTSLIVALVTAVFPTRKQVVAIAVILAGGVLVGVTGLRIEGANVPLGIALLLAASAFCRFISSDCAIGTLDPDRRWCWSMSPMPCCSCQSGIFSCRREWPRQAPRPS